MIIMTVMNCKLKQKDSKCIWLCNRLKFIKYEVIGSNLLLYICSCDIFIIVFNITESKHFMILSTESISFKELNLVTLSVLKESYKYSFFKFFSIG